MPKKIKKLNAEIETLKWKIEHLEGTIKERSAEEKAKPKTAFLYYEGKLIDTIEFTRLDYYSEFNLYNASGDIVCILKDGYSALTVKTEHLKKENG